jgi:hypothetical protein
MRLLAIALLLLPIAARAQAKPADEVIIYRCTDHDGHLTLRDTPCGKDQVQQTLTMLRPKDAPPVHSAPRAAQAPASPVPTPSVVVMREPRPLYECTPPDGEPYTSDTPEGRPRWVPLWTLGVPYSGLSVASTQGMQVAVERGSADRNGGGRDTDDRGGHRPHPRGGFGYSAYGAGTWIRDTCYALPQADVCARLVDRRDAIRKRFFNAMPSERDTLNVEERSINARLDADCGAY